ncbi:MAG: site-specific integrase [Oscillospiraceae bacterium]|jgi:integrase|nr:site-specific integrase [Oscillospiraceae bacterium]
MPRTGANIYKRKDGRWEARCVSGYKADGSLKYQSLYAKTYAEAKRKQIEAAAQRYAPAAVEPPEILLEHAAADWLASVRLRVKASTFGKYERIVRLHVLPALGRFRVALLSQAQVEQFAGGLIAGGLSLKTAQDVLMVTKAILKYAKAPVCCDCGGITIKNEPKEMRVLSKPEQDALSQYLTKNADAGSTNAPALGVLLSLYTGIRIGELCALRWQDIDLTENTLHITGTLQRVPDFSGEGAKTRVTITSPKSKCSVRTIPLPEFLIPLLQARAAQPKAYLLTGEKVRFVEPRTVQNHFKRYIVACGIADANFHCLRHTFATRCIELGFDVKTLSKILGHSSVSITLGRYVHSSLDLKRANMRKLKP